MSQVISNNVQDGAAQPDKSQSSSGGAGQAPAPKGVAAGAAIAGGPGAAIGSLVDNKTANQDADKIHRQVEASKDHPKHTGPTQGMTDPTAQ
ncbi:hypothetical protein WJX74_008802 [Apatococcus lobatus]|uniref:Uncharacterized protein n=1 Tax=Apatococcus lobatus TaxID=904363 RepID=A0AAW1RTQ9_9CHLO